MSPSQYATIPKQRSIRLSLRHEWLCIKISPSGFTTVHVCNGLVPSAKMTALIRLSLPDVWQGMVADIRWGMVRLRGVKYA